MSPAGKAMAVVGWLAVLAAAVFFIVLNISPDVAEGMGSYFETMATNNYGRTLAWILVACMLIADLLVLVWTLVPDRKEKPIEFQSDVGSMVVEVTALQDCMRRTAMDDPDVTEAESAITVPQAGKDSPIVCEMRVGLLERADVPGKGREVATRLKDKLLEVLPMEVEPIVNLRITIVRPPRRRRLTVRTTPPPREGEAAPPLEGAFTGQMRYPVEQEQAPEEEAES